MSQSGSASGFNKALFALSLLCIAATAALDNLRGPMLPILAERLSLSYTSSASFVACVSLGALLMMAASTKILASWPQRVFLTLSIMLQITAAVGAALSKDFASLLASGVFWGAGNAGLGLSSNLYAIASSPLHLRGKTLSALHVCYGVFAVLPALYLPWAITRTSFALALIAPFFMLALPFAAAHRQPENFSPEEESPKEKENFGLDAWILVGGFSIYVLGEVILSTWAVTYLISRGISLSSAGKILGGFFASLAVGRLFVVYFLKPSFERFLPPAGAALGAVFFAAALAGWDAGIAWSGLALAPVFPLMAAGLAADYPTRYKHLLSLAYSAMVTLILAGHQGFGLLSDAFGVQKAYALPLICFILSAISLGAREWLRRPARS